MVSGEGWLGAAVERDGGDQSAIGPVLNQDLSQDSTLLAPYSDFQSFRVL